MAPARSVEGRQVLAAAALEAEDVLRGILRAEGHSDVELASQLTDCPLKPFIIASARCLLLVKLKKTACLLGSVTGQGVLLARVPTSHESLIKFSAPLLVSVSMASFGLSLGTSSTAAFVACMDKQLQEHLLRSGRRSLVGLDAGFHCGATLSSRADPLLLLGCASGLQGTVAVSKTSGGLLDLSFSGGSLRIDAKRQAQVYGGDATPAAVLSGEVEPPPEFQPLYAELSLMVHQMERPSPPSRASFSLERFSTGRDPDAVLVLNNGTVLDPQQQQKLG